MAQKKETSEKLAALFSLKIGNISPQLEETGREFYQCLAIKGAL